MKKVLPVMKKILPAVLGILLAVLLGLGLATGRKSNTDTLRIYCPADPAKSKGGDALTTVQEDWSQMRTASAEEQAAEALQLLLGGCQDSEFRQAIPAATKLRSCHVTGSTAQVDFSTAYRQLSGMDLTIADYCVALTLVQIPGIYTVRITVDGEDLAYRDSNTFRGEYVLLTSQEDVVRNLPAAVSCLNSATLVTEERILTVYEGESPAAAVMEALRCPPEGDGFSPLLPEDFQELSAKVEEGVCYLNLPSAVQALLPEDPTGQERMVKGIVQSLCSIRDIREVNILIDGEQQPCLGTVDISEPMSDK